MSVAWQMFLESLSDDELNEAMRELVDLTDGDYDDVACEYVMLLHGLAIPMPRWASNRKEGEPC